MGAPRGRIIVVCGADQLYDLPIRCAAHDAASSSLWSNMMAESHEVLKKSLEQVGAKKVAADMNVSTSLVYKWCQEPAGELCDGSSGTRNPLDRVIALYESTADFSIIEWICGRVGGFLVRNPDVPPDSIDTQFIAQTQRMIRDFSELLQVISESITNDGRVDSGEASRIRDEWQQLKQYAEAFVVACEKGCFDTTA